MTTTKSVIFTVSLLLVMQYGYSLIKPNPSKLIGMHYDESYKSMVDSLVEQRAGILTKPGRNLAEEEVAQTEADAVKASDEETSASGEMKEESGRKGGHGMHHGAREGKGKHREFQGRLRSEIDSKHHHHSDKKTKSHGWMDGFTHSTIMIVSMEFMDKTFFISAIMSMTHNKWLILVASLAALFLMNGISCAMGVVLPIIMSRNVTVTIAAVLFIFFGIKMLLEGIKMDSDDKGELEEAQEEIKASMKLEDAGAESSPLISTPSSDSKMCKPSNNVMMQVFIMIFFAEWGDRSQVSTILLAGTNPVLAVFLGGCVGYFVTSLLAVLAGSCLASRVSPKMITITGGVMFLVFAVQTVFMKD